VKEKEHENYYLEQIKDRKLLPLFEKVFGWGLHQSFNAIDEAVMKHQSDDETIARTNSKGCKVK
jgi:hypothetical protein